MSNSKTVVIGLDGAPFDVIRNLADRGILPNLKKLIDKGSFGCLQSSFLPTSPVAWTSILTGKNSGKHNVYDWAWRQEGTYKVKRVTSLNVKAPLLTDILKYYGRTAGIFNVPVTYPPFEVEGFLVSGFDTPGTDTVFTYPGRLSGELKKQVGDYPLAFRQAYVPGREKDFMEDLKDIITRKREAIFYLRDNFDLDFYLFVLMELDHLHHKMWKCLNDTEKQPYFYEVYRLIDSVVADIVDRFPDDTSFFVISDHGAGPLEGIMYINKWLWQKGLLKVKNTPGMFLKKFLENSNVVYRSYRVLSRLGLGKLMRKLPPNVQGVAATSFFSFGDIDWKNTKAYSFGRYGQIYVNLKGREPRGTVEAGDEYESLIRDIMNGLSDIKHPVTGEKMITDIKRREEVYRGPYLENSPDILFEINGLSYASAVKFGFRGEGIFGDPEFFDSGTHRREGTFIAAGQNIKKGSI